MARPVQISMDEELLERIDSDDEVQKRGRSEFVRRAISCYLAAKQRREIDEEILKAYEGRADDMLDEVAELMELQSWSRK